jgi:hypothetical protein
MWEDNVMAFQARDLILIKVIRRRWGKNIKQQPQTTSVFFFFKRACLCAIELKDSNKFDGHESVHRNINLIETTNKMQPCSRIYYFNVS